MQRSKETISSLVFSHLVSEHCLLAPSLPSNPQGVVIQQEERARCERGEGRQEVDRKDAEWGRGLRVGWLLPSPGAVMDCSAGLGQIYSEVSCHPLILGYLWQFK